MTELANKFKMRYGDRIPCPFYNDNELAHFINDWKGLFKFDTSLNEWLSIDDFKKLNKSIPNDQASYITIAPSKYRVPIPYTQENINTLINFGEKIAYLYNPYYFVVESGKHAESPHLHIHILGKIKNSKKHLGSLRAKWEQLTGFTIDWKSDDYLLKQWRKHPDMPTYQDWIDEKISYFTDDYKGTHKNFEVLMPGPGGPGGF